MEGVIVKFNSEKLFGFIRVDEKSEDIFFHKSDFLGGQSALRIGTKVSFSAVKAEKGLKAKNIAVLKANTNPSAYSFFYGAMLILLVLVAGTLKFYSGLNLPAAYLIAVNVSAFVLVGYDKGIAGKGSLRVPEGVIFLTALIGGSIGVLLAMKIFRHKTQKASFQFSLALIVVVQVLLVGYVKHSGKLPTVEAHNNY